MNNINKMNSKEFKEHKLNSKQYNERKMYACFISCEFRITDPIRMRHVLLTNRNKLMNERKEAKN